MEEGIMNISWQKIESMISFAAGYVFLQGSQ